MILLLSIELEDKSPEEIGDTLLKIYNNECFKDINLKPALDKMDYETWKQVCNYLHLKGIAHEQTPSLHF